jgi:hypothetical protein
MITDMLFVCTKLLIKSPDLTMWSLGLGGGATWRNSGDLAGELGRGVAGEALGDAGNRLWCLLTAEEVTDGRAWRRPAAASAGGGCSGAWRLGLSNK